MKWLGEKRLDELTQTVARLEAETSALRQENVDLRHRLNEAEWNREEVRRELDEAKARIEEGAHVSREANERLNATTSALADLTAEPRSDPKLELGLQKLDLRLTLQQEEVTKLVTGLFERVELYERSARRHAAGEVIRP